MTTLAVAPTLVTAQPFVTNHPFHVIGESEIRDHMQVLLVDRAFCQSPDWHPAFFGAVGTLETNCAGDLIVHGLPQRRDFHCTPEELASPYGELVSLVHNCRPLTEIIPIDNDD